MSDGNDLQRLKRLWPWLRPDAVLFVISLVCAPASALLQVAQPYLLKVAIDEHILKGDVAGVQHIGLMFLAAAIGAFVVEGIYTVTLSYGSQNAITRVRSDVVRHTLSLGRSYYDRTRTGRLLTRATSDVEALGETLTAGAATIVLDVLLVLGTLGAMAMLDPWLTLLLCAVAPPVAFFLDRIRRVLRTLYLTVRESMSELNAYLAERLELVRVVQLFRDEERSSRGHLERLTRYRDATIRTNVWDALLYATVDGLSAICVGLILWYGSGGLLEGVLTAGTLVAFVEYLAKLFNPIREFSAKLAVLQRAGSALEKIFGLLDVEERVEGGTAHLPSAPHGDFVLSDVHFAYGDGPDVLRGLDLALRAGEVVAVVGRTGSGKSTIGRLLTRTYGGYRGSITLDGQELTALDVTDVRSAVSTVAQDVHLFAGDVRFNLTLGHDVDDARLHEAIRLARAEQVVERLGGLDGQLSEKGSNLSVGEGQLISIARTLAHDAPVVIMDEATASVDSHTEALIQEATSEVLARKTVLVIAHRLSTITGADRIAVLKDGVVAECGSHDELLGRGGLYAELFQSAFVEAAK